MEEGRARDEELEDDARLLRTHPGRANTARAFWLALSIIFGLILHTRCQPTEVACASTQQKPLLLM